MAASSPRWQCSSTSRTMPPTGMFMSIPNSCLQMQRAYDDDENSNTDDDDDDFGGDNASDTMSYHNREIESDVPIFAKREAEDRPIALSGVKRHPFHWHPVHPYRDPIKCLYEGNGITIAPCGLALDTCFINLANAVHYRDESSAAVYILEIFRTFVYTNERMCFFPPSSLEPQTLYEEFGTVGPFSSILSWGIHQRIWSELLEIFVDQVGIADPVVFIAIYTLWKSYERCLFILPMTSLAKLLAIVNTLCHARKDASVPILRNLCEDTATARAWRAHITSPQGQRGLATLLTRTDTERTLTLLRVQEHYFTTRLRLELYAKVACTSPHPIYLAQAGAMRHKFIVKLIDGIRQDLGGVSIPGPVIMLSTLEDAMTNLSRHVNNADGRCKWIHLQEGLQILAYLLRMVCVTPGIDITDLFETSEHHVSVSPICVTEEYARTAWNASLSHRLLDGGSAVILWDAPASCNASARSKTHITAELMRAFNSRPKTIRTSAYQEHVHGIVRSDATGVFSWRDGCSIMTNDLLRPLAYLKWVYLVRLNQKKVDRIAVPADTPHEPECDGDLFDVESAKRIGNSEFAFEVDLTGRGANILRAASCTASDLTTTVAVPLGVANSLVEILQPRDDAPTKAVVLWNVRSTRHATRKVVLHRWPLHTGDNIVIGKAYDCTIIPFDRTKVVMSMAELLGTTRRLNVPALFSACTRPEYMARLLVTMEQTHCLKDTKDHYVSFRIQEKDELAENAVVVRDVEVHAIAWADRSTPDPEISEKIEKLAENKPRIVALIEKYRR